MVEGDRVAGRDRDQSAAGAVDEMDLAAVRAVLGGAPDGATEAGDEVAGRMGFGYETSEGPRSVDDLRRLFPELARALENAGAQRREAQLRRDAGTRAGSRLRVREALRRLGVPGLDDRDERQFEVLYELAAAQASDELMRTLASEAVGAYGLAPAELTAVESAIGELSGGELSSYASRLFQGAVDAAARQRAMELPLDELTEESAPDLHRQIADEVDRRVVAELRARDLERRPRRAAPPASPQGRAPGGSGNYDLNDPIQVLRAYREGFFESESEAQRALARTFAR